VEQVTCHNDDLGRIGNDAVDRDAECVRDVSFTLIQPPGGLPVVLAEAEMDICEVGELHGL